MEIANVSSSFKGEVMGCDPVMPRAVTLEERLLQQKVGLESRLADINAALEALQANPEILKVLSLISKVNY